MKVKDRLYEMENALKELLEREEERKRSYEEKLTDFEVKSIEKDLEREAEELKKVYPEFDREKELENGVFVNLLLAGLDMKTAYEAVHLDEIKEKAEVEKELSEEPKKVKRPVENGSLGSESAIFKSGVHALTGKDRKELAKRALRGEIIKF